MRVPTATFYQTQMITLSNQYQNIQRLNQQISQQSKILSSSDDPVLAYRIAQTNDYISDLNSYSQSSIAAQSRTQTHEAATQQAVGILDQLNQLLIRSQDDTQNDTDRATYAKQMQGLLTSLLNIANTQDGSGDYVFSGYNSNVPPYALNNGNYQYQGSYEKTSVNIGDGVTSIYSESGFDVFGAIRQGNGTFTVQSSPSNTGTVATDAGSLISGIPYVPDTYTISFVTNSSGQLAYQVTGATSGQVVPAPPATTPANAPQYIAGQKVQFNGLGITINGKPNPGDSLTVQPSQNQDIFNTIQGVITALQTPTNGNATSIAQLHQVLSQGSASVGQASNHLLAYHSEVGTRLAAINNQIQANQSLLNDQAGIMDNLQGLDMYEALSTLNELSLSLQATQGSYMQIQSLFANLFKM